MEQQHAAVIPPAPRVHARDLSTLRLLLTTARSTLDIWPDYIFDVSFSRRTVLGRESVLLYDPPRFGT